MEWKQVVYSCNDNYIEQTLISIVSLLKHNHDRMRIWIVSDHIDRANQSLLKHYIERYQAECIILDIEDVLQDLCITEGSRHPKTIYSKLFLENRIDADRVLYLDSDTVVTGNLGSLWKRSMDGELAAGVQMPYSEATKEKMGINPRYPYLCDGVVLINLELWRKKNIGKQCQSYIQKHDGAPLMLSEGTLNYVCQGFLGVLEPQYNLMSSMIVYTSEQMKKLFQTSEYYSDQQLKEARENPLIIHYINELFNRPWLEPCDHPYKEIYRCERELLFGKIPYLRQKLNRNTRRTRILRRVLPFEVFAALYHMKHKG